MQAKTFLFQFGYREGGLHSSVRDKKWGEIQDYTVASTG